MTVSITTDAITPALHRKAWSFALVFLPLLLPWLSLRHGAASAYPTLFMFWTPVVVFGLVPLLDYLIGKDTLNPNEEQSRVLSTQPWYRTLTLLCLPLQFASLISGAVVAVQLPGGLALLGWIVSFGTVSSVLAITVAHELIHKNEKLDQWTGGILLASVCYGGFKIEHVRGHHVHVSTPEDASSARYGETVYGFVPRAIIRNVHNAFRLEAIRLRQKGLPIWSWRNECVAWTALSGVFAVTAALLFGWHGVLFFFGQSLVAIVLLETVNYIEHYGLHRRLQADGRYERVTHLHSWNSSYRLSNLLLFHLQRHSDHHAFPKRRYQILRHFDDSPQLPGGYPTMVMLAWLPPLWFAVMNPRVRAYYGGDPDGTN
ncbi:alkane 1-monooxygenase [Permianibacter sp. IMCC34836]|uniref:alkane 1-monooxygenase n=1 Tax=Permianibacter fluminis TaxID=2738515 RepID=UPI00155516FB|nr:alkane 1-monooxygenase [Permianibacter fluminis]NQD37104.1 alkane 1-monooxygenase [Permianibacter fluminis]